MGAANLAPGGGHFQDDFTTDYTEYTDGKDKRWEETEMTQVWYLQGLVTEMF
jgi:hypothetical protein